MTIQKASHRVLLVFIDERGDLSMVALTNVDGARPVHIADEDVQLPLRGFTGWRWTVIGEDRKGTRPSGGQDTKKERP